MVEKRIIRSDKFFFINFLKNLNLFKILFILFTFGFILGSILIGFNHEETVKQLGILMQKFVKTKDGRSFFALFISSFYSFIIPTLVFLVIGFFPLSQPISFFILTFHGLGLGLLTSFLYSYYGFKGFIFCILIIAPCEIIYTFDLLLSAKCSIQFSNKILKNLLPGKFKKRERKFLKEYLKQFVILFGIQIIAAFVDSLTTLFFLKFLL